MQWSCSVSAAASFRVSESRRQVSKTFPFLMPSCTICRFCSGIELREHRMLSQTEDFTVPAPLLRSYKPPGVPKPTPIEILHVSLVGLRLPLNVDRRLFERYQPPLKTPVNRTQIRLEGRTMKLILGKDHPGHCPTCGSTWIHRSRRKDLMESLLHYVLFMSPYRCNECDERHLRFRLAKHIQRPPTHSPRHAS
jgi:hypothetical protein